MQTIVSGKKETNLLYRRKDFRLTGNDREDVFRAAIRREIRVDRSAKKQELALDAQRNRLGTRELTWRSIEEGPRVRGSWSVWSGLVEGAARAWAGVGALGTYNGSGPTRLLLHAGRGREAAAASPIPCYHRTGPGWEPMLPPRYANIARAIAIDRRATADPVRSLVVGREGLPPRARVRGIHNSTNPSYPASVT